MYVYDVLRSQGTNKIIEATIKNITYIDAYLWNSETFNNTYKVNLLEGLTVTGKIFKFIRFVTLYKPKKVNY